MIFGEDFAMSFFPRATITGLLTGVLGLVFSVLPIGIGLEENIGLDLLFKLRGARKAPPNVIIVAMDNFSAKTLHLSSQPNKWPRSLHTGLTEYLSKEGAAVIAFDINFSEPLSMKTDQLFANAIQNARNVVLCEYLKKEIILLTDEKGAPKGNLNIEKRVPPTDLLARSAVALAPFPLPKVPIRVSQYWAFKTSAGEMPTLPVVVFQIFALDVYREFIQFLAMVHPVKVRELPYDKNEIITDKKTETLILALRDIFRANSSTAPQLLSAVKTAKPASDTTEKDQVLKSLIKMYQGPDSRYLNFYGPPGTIPTFSYCRVLQDQTQRPPRQKKIDFSGKAVFVGYSECLMPAHKDGFHTSFSQSSGVDISGVEITATAFANLLEDMPVVPLHFVVQGGLVFFWGVLLGMVCCFFGTPFSALGMVGFSIVYLMYAQYQFGSNGIWYPLMVPLFLQPFIAFCSAVLWKYADMNKDRQNIRKAFGYYLPDKVVDQLVKNIVRKETSSQIVYGTCLCTDAGQYTSLSETMAPEDLRQVMHQYYKALFEPVKQNGGMVINIVGDSMLALWGKPHPDIALRNQACLAALDIIPAVNRFNQSSENIRLPTRMGLHYGHISLGNVGAMDHYEYRPTGDIVNTASRMEGLNKYLGTEILVSGDVMDQLKGFLTRELGYFFLSGKARPVAVYELICRRDDASEHQRDLCRLFFKALTAYREQSWEKAMEFFHETIRIHQQDGPSLFYAKRIQKHIISPPGEQWDGIVHMNKK
jgi:adenylate cyclase